MKTQLLEDIGQSATKSLVPSGRVANNSNLLQEVQDIAREFAAAPAKPRADFSVWRQKPERKPADVATEQPYQPPPSQTTPAAFEPSAAVEPPHVPPQPMHEAANSPAEPTFAADALHSGYAQQGPVFDFTMPSPATPSADLFKHEPTWFERSGQRYLLWGSCVLAGALAIYGGLWLYEERKAERALALVASEMKGEQKVDKTVMRRAIAAKEFTLRPDGEVRVAPAAPAAPVPSPDPLPQRAATVPPLVLLAPDAAADAKVASKPAPGADRKETLAPPKPEQAAEPARAAQLSKQERRARLAQKVAAAKPVRAKVERAPERQLARAAALQEELKSDADYAKAATLKACREHGYSPAQCVKRACSVTQYGFVCRGK